MLVDDHHLVRAGVRSILEQADNIRIVGEADCGEQALALANLEQVQLAALDIQMPGMSTEEIIKKLLALSPPVYSIILTSSTDELLIARMLSAGACGYVTKFCENEHLLQAIQKVACGERYLSPDIAKQLAYHALNQTNQGTNPGKDLLEKLSERETQTFVRLTQGKTVKEIAKEFGVSPKTINTYRQRTFQKLHVSNDVELIKLIARSNLLE
jgi:two-component system invasion response regulator UvrY